MVYWSGCLTLLGNSLRPLQVLRTADMKHGIDHRRFSLSTTSSRSSLIGCSNWCLSLADERAWLSQIDAYVGSGGGEWAGGSIDSDDDFCCPDEGGSDDDYGAGDYL
jgi:hypothetical protein